jgi:hypothetical protein
MADTQPSQGFVSYKQLISKGLQKYRTRSTLYSSSEKTTKKRE